MCAGRLKHDDVSAAGTKSKMNYIHSHLLDTMRAENRLTPYYHNSFHTSQLAERSAGMLKTEDINNKHKQSLDK